MDAAFYISYIILLCTAKALSVVPVILPLVPEHRLHVRSTPSLDPVEELLEKFGSENKLNFSQVDDLLKSIGLSGTSDMDTKRPTKNGEQTCFSSKYFYGMYSKNDGNINRTDLIDLCPALLYQLSKKECKDSKVKKEDIQDDEDSEGKEDPTRAWGFGFLFVTIISLGSLLGALVVPIMERPFYKKVLMSMVSLAVGVLGGSGIFHLIPSAFGFPPEDNDQSYLWKCAMIAIGVYVFFVLECSMKLYIRYKAMKRKAIFEYANGQEEKKSYYNGVELQKCEGSLMNGHGHSHGGPTTMNGRKENVGISESECIENGIHNGDAVISNTEVIVKTSEKKPIATVAWMIIIGDGLHNFIDGLAIGASFSSSVVVGISTSLAVISEEVPHELGDFAILLNSGFTYKKAMLANFASACCCYIGLVIGLVLGYATSAVKYIYGIAGGMFLYISLVDMLPEALEMAYALSGNSTMKSIKMILVVNLAMVFGFCIMLVLAYYGPSIEL